jgi:choline monooxygenase
MSAGTGSEMATATRSLPAAAYTDPLLYEQEVTEIFGRAWSLAGHVSELASPGQYVTTNVGREPVVVVRGHDGELRAMSNVCRHRASLILEGIGATRSVMRCPYHAWTYELTGQLAAAPSARGFACFDRDSVALPRFRTGEVAGLVFCCCDPLAAPLSEVLGPVEPFLISLGLERMEVFQWPQQGARKSEDFDENWKILADNYLEDYHVPVAHPALVRLLDVKRTFGEENDWSEWSVVPMRSRPSRDERERRYQALVRSPPWMPDILNKAWGNVHIWPTTFMEIYPHHIDTWQLEPVGLTQTRAVTLTLASPEATDDDREARRLCHQLQHDVMAEDVEITSRVQRGVQAPSYQSGILNDEQEGSVIRFQSRLRDLLPRIAELESQSDGRAIYDPP